MILISESFDNKEWDDFVSSHPNGNIFQTSMMADIYHKTKNYSPICLAAKNSDTGDILAVMQGAIITEMKGLLSSFSSRAVIQGGPLFVDSDEGVEAAQQLCEHYNKLIGGRIVYTQIRNMWDTGKSKTMLSSMKYDYDQHLDFLIDLDREESAIWADIQKSRRKGVNRAEKSGIVVSRVSNKDELTLCYDLVLETYKKFKIPIADVSLFESIYDDLSSDGYADFFIAMKDGNAVGTRITLNYKDMVYDWYAGSKTEVDYVDEALVWHVLKENAGKYKVFDFGGAGHPDKPYGVREFKRRFGGEMVNFGRYEKVHSGMRMNVAMIGLNLYRKIK
jgi:lipid II:glycine glycyltransferase (peptidoglycan interpeptide bridge formation enzyme)